MPALSKVTALVSSLQPVVKVLYDSVLASTILMQADFSFFFDTGGRRRCYIAPERLYTSDTPEADALSEAPLHPSMVCLIFEGDLDIELVASHQSFVCVNANMHVEPAL